jgi:tRNA-specific 2-thiouridylase
VSVEPSLTDTAAARADAFVVPRAEKPRRVVVAMSGGVDSAVAAWLLKEMGHEVVGVSLRLAPDDGASLEVRHGRCCSVDDMTDARRVADAIGVPFHAVDARARFKEAVFDPFVAAWRKGLTPIPCLACNHEVKLGDLLETARSLDAALATGHYARKVRRGEAALLARPLDRSRDQTYYLYGTPFDVVDELELPLGDLDKPLVRALARRAGLPVHKKPDSQEICFVPDGDTAAVVERAGGGGRAGDLVHITGRKLRAHDGVHHFTVGQRRGTGVATPQGPDGAPADKLYVVDVDGDTGTVTLGSRADLNVTRVKAAPLRLAAPRSLWPERVTVQVRARHAGQTARWSVHDDTLALVFDEPVQAVALGQAAVCYDGDVLLGGGILVERSDGARPRALRLETP